MYLLIAQINAREFFYVGGTVGTGGADFTPESVVFDLAGDSWTRLADAPDLAKVHTKAIRLDDGTVNKHFAVPFFFSSA